MDVVKEADAGVPTCKPRDVYVVKEEDAVLHRCISLRMAPCTGAAGLPRTFKVAHPSVLCLNTKKQGIKHVCTYKSRQFRILHDYFNMFSVRVHLLA